MTNISKPIIFFGTEDFSLAALRGLIEAGYDITAVITKPDSPRGRSRKLTPPSVKVLASAHNIPVWQPAKLRDCIDDIKALQPVTGVLVSYGKIIPAEIIDLFTPAIINVHPSLLPKYRGPSPIEAAILHGDTETGVSIMQLAPAMDAGPVYASKIHPLTGHETKPELYQTLATVGTNLLLETLPAIVDSSLQPTLQDDDAATYCHLLTKEVSLLDPTILTATEAERHIRAYLGFPKSKLTIGDRIVVVTKAHVTNEPKTPLDVQFRDGAYLAVDELVAPSGRTMSAEAYLRGYAAA